ncbi:pentatricopeptide repeat-containing protein At5g39710-like [Asparagus officinalis]|uniref:pentatricopeptide repeat-containing protein At5g39710-like n=1 Tax=Asparagus officinalis TaxID=4686 RepID=UPI00098E0DA7|nr:pentatricopeptide repeat-containing protein At5g39710-like [Asparagus officinalis]
MERLFTAKFFDDDTEVSMATLLVVKQRKTESQKCPLKKMKMWDCVMINNDTSKKDVKQKFTVMKQCAEMPMIQRHSALVGSMDSTCMMDSTSVECVSIIRPQLEFSRRNLLRRVHKYSFAALSTILDDPLVDSIEKTSKTSQVNQFSSCTMRSPTIFPYVAVSVKTLNRDIFREVKFTNAMEIYGLSHALESFSMLVRIFSLVKMRGEVRHLLLDVMVFDNGLFSEVVRFSSGLITPLKAYGDLIKALVDNSMIENALEFNLEAMGIGLEMGVPLCNSLLECFVEKNNVRVVRSLFEYMKVLRPSPNIYTTMMNLYIKGNTLDVEEANKILVEMENHGVRPNAHKELEYDNYYYNAVILDFYRKGELNKAFTGLDEMKKCGLSPDVHSYSIFIDGFCKEGNVSETWNLFEEMHRRELMPNVITYTSLLCGFCSA